MEENNDYKVMREILRWIVFLFVILPFLPAAVVAFLLGMAWAISKECFLGGAGVLSIYDDTKA